MLTRLTATLESVSEHTATLQHGDAAFSVLVPAYVSRALEGRTGKPVTLHTLLYLEGQGQGTSFIPRLIGFSAPLDREFFELFTTVKGIGNRKALRAMAEPPSVIAAAIARRDTKALTNLPEIGKRMAETVIAELTGKVDRFLLDGIGAGLGKGASIIEPTIRSNPALEDAIAALCNLGETRVEAEQKISRALQRAASAGKPLTSPDEIIAAVFAGR